MKTLNYEIKRSYRKSIGLYVKDGQVEVRAPKYVDDFEIDNYVNNQFEWLVSTIEKEKIRNAERPEIIDGGEFLFLGNKRTFSFVEGAPSVYESGNSIVVAHRKSADIETLVYKWLRKEAEQYISVRVLELAKIMGDSARVTKLGFRKTKTKWGHCTNQGQLQFNWLIIMAPPEVIEYLIIHELSHLRHMNHSKSFYARVKKYCPDHKKWSKWLDDNGHKLWFKDAS